MDLALNSCAQNFWSTPNSTSDDDSRNSSSLCDSDNSAQAMENNRGRKRRYGDIYPTEDAKFQRTNETSKGFGLPTSFQDMQLRIVRQPEEQHRARYMSEGSRGAVKDKSGKSHCTVQLLGYGRPTVMRVYAGTESDPQMPHPLYRIIPVAGKGGSNLTTPCKESSDDGVHAIELTLRPENKMTAVLDCIGILKMCSHDLKRKVKKKSSKGARIRLVFRVSIPDPLSPHNNIIIQTFSDPISCVQHLGFPEIQKMSMTSDVVHGGSEMIILGRNFDRNTTVIFREYNADGRLVWTSMAEMERKFCQTCHLVCSVPTYRDLTISQPVEITVVVECGSKISHSHQFTYKPELKKEPPAKFPPCPQTPFQQKWETEKNYEKWESEKNCVNSYNLPRTEATTAASGFYVNPGLYQHPHQQSQLAPNSVPESPPEIGDDHLTTIMQNLESSDQAIPVTQILQNYDIQPINASGVNFAPSNQQNGVAELYSTEMSSYATSYTAYHMSNGRSEADSSLFQ